MIRYNKIEVTLNGKTLVEGIDYFWRPGELLLMAPAPKSLGFWKKMWLRLTGRGDYVAAASRVSDIVTVENWAMGQRDVYLSGTPEFASLVQYVDDFAGV